MHLISYGIEVFFSIMPLNSILHRYQCRRNYQGTGQPFSNFPMIKSERDGKNSCFLHSCLGNGTVIFRGLPNKARPEDGLQRSSYVSNVVSLGFIPTSPRHPVLVGLMFRFSMSVWILHNVSAWCGVCVVCVSV
jgi:hypothetical protein